MSNDPPNESLRVNTAIAPLPPNEKERLEEILRGSSSQAIDQRKRRAVSYTHLILRLQRHDRLLAFGAYERIGPKAEYSHTME